MFEWALSTCSQPSATGQNEKCDVATRQPARLLWAGGSPFLLNAIGLLHCVHDEAGDTRGEMMARCARQLGCKRDFTMTAGFDATIPY